MENQASNQQYNFKSNTQIGNFEIASQTPSIFPERKAFESMMSAVLGEKVDFNFDVNKNIVSYPNPDLELTNDNEFTDTKVKTYNRGNFTIEIRFVSLTRTFSTPDTIYTASLTVSNLQEDSQILYYIDFNNEEGRRYAKLIQRPFIDKPLTHINSDQFIRELINLKNPNIETHF